MMACHKIKMIAELKELTHLMNKIETRHSALFNSMAWFQLWTETFWQHNWKLHAYIVFENKIPIAFLPFYTQQPKGLFRLKTLYPLSQGEPEKSEITSEYNDLYIVKGYEEAVIKLLANKLKTLKIDQIKWRATLENSHINRLLKVAFNYQATATHARYLIDRVTWSLDNLSKNSRSRYKRSINQLNKINASFKWVEQADYEHFSHILAQLHQIRWNNKGSSGAFAENDFQAFHRHFRATNPNNIRISAIMVDNQPIAINYYLADESTLYFYQCGWDESNYSNLSPGFALHLWSIVHCNFVYYDFMMGGVNDSYKAKFGCKKTPMFNNHIIINKWQYRLNKLTNKMLNYFL